MMNRVLCCDSHFGTQKPLSAHLELLINGHVKNKTEKKNWKDFCSFPFRKSERIIEYSFIFTFKKKKNFAHINLVCVFCWELSRMDASFVGEVNRSTKICSVSPNRTPKQNFHEFANGVTTHMWYVEQFCFFLCNTTRWMRWDVNLSSNKKWLYWFCWIKKKVQINRTEFLLAYFL